MMIRGTEIHNAYIHLYKYLRKYVWDIDAVCAIAEVEIASHRALPSLSEVAKSLQSLKVFLIDLFQEDEELLKAFTEFKALLLDGREVYSKLVKFSKISE